MRLQLGIYGTPDSPYVNELNRAALLIQQRPALVLMRYAEMQVSLGQLDSRGKVDIPAPAPLDAIIVRSMPLGTLEQMVFRMDCLQAWESLGIPVINPARSLETAIDKWLTLQRLAAAGLPVPRTVACQSRDAAMQAFVDLGSDVVVKPLFGGEGRGIVRVDHPDLAWRVFGAIQQVGQVFYVQQFVQHLGYDVRVLFVGKKCFSIKRRAQGTWLTNISQGSIAEPHELSEIEFELAIRSAEAIGGSVLGIDILPTVDGRRLVLEVNAVPGWKGTSKALGVDVAQEVLTHVCSEAISQKNQ
ncbi:MAG: RimK family alpha-L-glutamate ligase [Planctomycetales bacterium]|nr:RimK family alpha-L-glutamate ligase [Planctomycetales bacterium]